MDVGDCDVGFGGCLGEGGGEVEVGGVVGDEG